MANSFSVELGDMVEGVAQAKGRVRHRGSVRADISLIPIGQFLMGISPLVNLRHHRLTREIRSKRHLRPILQIPGTPYAICTAA
jgi:hypothetical protein